MAPLVYFTQVSLYTLIMWGIYFIVWRNRTLHTYSRAYLLTALVLPAILPLVHIPVSVVEPTVFVGYSVALPRLNVSSAGSLQPVHTVSWPGLFTWVYAGGSVLLVIFYILAYARINRKLHQGRRVQYAGHTLITDTAIGPGTLGRRIFFPSGEVDRLILKHELAHIQAGHRYDSMLLQALHVIFWVSPAHWLLGKELKIVHEFEADGIASEGVDSMAYASLLLSQSLGTAHSFPIAQSFFRHPLKRRIMMLQKIKAPKRSSLLFAAFALTIGFMSTVLLAQTAQPGKSVPGLNITYAQLDSAVALLDMDIVKRNTPPKPGQVRIMEDGNIVFVTADKMPAFNGNFREWMLHNLNYSESAKKQGLEGAAYMEFIVDELGAIRNPRLIRSSGHFQLDEEAMRVVKKMPAWKPGTHNGKPVPVLFTLPVYFGKENGGGC